ncbi:MAG: nitrate- and nitrite sensing domain-containing protein [Desulfobacterales bacterium]|nr:nitrate- and nitrite sensing domain-containing protein [Desulfobacterales bacterium]
MKIRHKILLCISLPAIIAILLGIQYIRVQIDNTNTSHYMQNNIIMMADTSDLVTSLQKERGLSSLYIGNKIDTNRENVENQRKETDKLLSIFNKSIIESHVSKEPINKAKLSLDKLDSLRVNVFKAEESASILFQYTEIIRDLMGLIKAAVKGKTSFGLGKRMTNLTLLTEAQENAALFRGTLSGVLSANKPIIETRLETLINLRAGTIVNLTSPALILSDKTDEGVKSLIKSQDFKKMSEAFQTVIVKSKQGDYNIDAKEFFDTVTRIISKIIEIQNEEKKILLKETSKIRNESIKTIWFTIIFALSIFIGFSILTFFIVQGIIQPINKTVIALKDIAEGDGDLTKRIDVKYKDELGELAEWFNIFIKKIQAIITEIRVNSQKLTSSSSALSQVSNHLSSTAEEVKSQSNALSSNAEHVSSHISTVAAGAEEASASVINISQMTEKMSRTFQDVSQFAQKIVENVKEVALSSENMSDGETQISAAVEEMTASLNEVAKHTAEANRISKDASTRTTGINSRMDTLVKSSKQIGKIVGIIKNIADKTDMLALNATIEAAGAGDSGKGFGVVASEVKELARQSTEATEEISEQIEQIQKGTNEAVSAIESINHIIKDIAAINETIAAAVEEQSATANEIAKTISANVRTVKEVASNANESSTLVAKIAQSIEQSSQTAMDVARNVEEVAAGVNDVAKSTSESANGVKEISNTINIISNAAKESSKSATQTDLSSAELSRMASLLSELVARFKI